MKTFLSLVLQINEKNVMERCVTFIYSTHNVLILKYQIRENSWEETFAFQSNI